MNRYLGIFLYKKAYQITILSCLAFAIFALIGCTTSGEEEQSGAKLKETLETKEKLLTILYDGTGEYLIKSFMSAHPEINIKLIECIPISDDEIDIQDIISKNEVPDLIIGGEEISGYLSEWYREGYIADVGAFCSNDASISTDNYFPETFEIFREKDNIYALPLGISVDFMLTSESKYYDSAFSKLEEGYTGRELLNVLLEEVQKEKESGEFFSEINRNPLAWMCCLGGLIQTDDGIQMDEELFKQVYELAYKNGRLQAEARSFWIEQGKTFDGTTGYAFPCALDPRRYEGNFTVDIGSLEDAPALVLSYAETAYQNHIEEGIKAIYLPTADDGSKYQARVKVWGAVAEESRQKELAYELLRALMDEEINVFGWVRGVSPDDKNVYPINRANAISLLDRFESQTATLMYENNIMMVDQMVDRIDVSAEEKEKHDEMLSNISGLYCWTSELSMVADIFNVYFDAYISDYERCYLDMLNTFNTDEMAEYLPNLGNQSGEEEESEDIVKVERNETSEVMELKAEIKNTEIGETFFLGETEQDNNFENGAEPIEWIILEKTEKKAFVISKKVLEWLTFSKFNDWEEIERGVWGGDPNKFSWELERNQQREWLVNDLYENGFTESEKEIIEVTHNVTPDFVPRVREELESDDYLYIPTKEEVETYMNVQMRQAEMTTYVSEKASKGGLGYINWTIRTEGRDGNRLGDFVVQIAESGEFGDIHTFVPSGVRPVMWLDIS